MRRLILLLASVALCAAALSTGVTAATAPPSDPTRATQLATTGLVRASDGDGQRVTPAQAVSLLGGVSTAASALAGQVCWFRDWMWIEWGNWPYQQRVREWRSWCAQYVGGPQTYRATQVHLGTLICSGHDRFQFLAGGGNGYRYSTVRTGASFDCNTTLPWFVIHTERWMEYSCNTQGHCAWVRNS